MTQPAASGRTAELDPEWLWTRRQERASRLCRINTILGPVTIPGFRSVGELKLFGPTRNRVMVGLDITAEQVGRRVR